MPEKSLNLIIQSPNRKLVKKIEAKMKGADVPMPYWFLKNGIAKKYCILKYC